MDRKKMSKDGVVLTIPLCLGYNLSVSMVLTRIAMIANLPHFFA